MIVAWADLVLAVVGVLVYGFAGNAKAREVGRIAFFVGLFWVAARLAGHSWQVWAKDPWRP